MKTKYLFEFLKEENKINFPSKTKIKNKEEKKIFFKLAKT